MPEAGTVEESLFSFEQHFELAPHLAWMEQNWALSLYVTAVYVACALLGRHRMHRKVPYNLNLLLMVWNATMAAFSTAGAWRLLPAMLRLTLVRGFRYAVCDPLVLQHPVASGFWLWAYVVSKWVELGDTVFVVLRGRPLTFLHLFHHAMTMVSSWYGYAHRLGLGRWLVAVNYAVHSVMYTYYTLRSAGVPLSRRAAMAVTTVQLTQMVWGFVVSALTLIYILRGDVCTCNGLGATICTLMYAAYILLFVRFFRATYVVRPLAKEKTEYISSSTPTALKNALKSWDSKCQ